jgi:predicted nucleotidyltransferase
MTNVSMAQRRIIKKLQSYFQRKALRFGVEVVFLYGSWAAGFPRLDSDIDLAILFDDEGIPEGQLFERLTAITLDLMKSLSSEVSVIPIYRDFRKPMLYYNAIVKGIPVFFTDRRKYIALINEALYHMEDFETFGRKWLIDLATRNLGEISHA